MKDFALSFFFTATIGLIIILYSNAAAINTLRHENFQLKKELNFCREKVENLGHELNKEELSLYHFQKENEFLTQEIINLQFEIKEMTSNPLSWVEENYKRYNVEASAYSPSVDECDEDPFVAASGEEVDDWTIAVSQNMRGSGWNFGKFIYVPEQDKFYKINDVMNKRYKRNIDFFVWTKKEARAYGRKDIQVYLLN